MEPGFKMGLLLPGARIRRLSLSTAESVFFFSSLGRDLSLVTTQLGDLSLRLHICPQEERREFVDGRGFTASVGTDSFPGLREHRGVPGNSLDEVLVRPG